MNYYSATLSKLLVPIVSIAILMLLYSCTKEVINIEEITEEIPVDNGEEEKAGNEKPKGDSVLTAKIVLSGDANGALVIDGSIEKYDCKIAIAIKGGVYSNIQVKNLKGQKGCPIQIINDGLVEVVGLRNHMLISNVSHVSINGKGSSNGQKGFLFRDNEYRSIVLEGTINDIDIAHIEFKNIGNYVISYNNQTVYDGSPDSYSNNLTFSYLIANNTGPLINFGGGINGSTIRGLVKNLAISYVTFANAPQTKNVVSVGMVSDYNVHHNEIGNVNANNNDHNAMFFLRGSGRFHNNYISDYQGNALRTWGVSVGTSPKEILIYNNIAVNSRKYSAFEVQSFEKEMLSGKTTFVNAKVFHNTCGNLNLSKDWYGVVIDAYRLLGGECQVFNNLAFNMPAPHPESKFVSYMSIESQRLSISNNLYFETSKAAGIINEKEFRLNGSSKAKGNGMKSSLITHDFYNTLRNVNTPSIGATE